MPGVGGRNNELTEHRIFLWQWNDSVWCYNEVYMSLYSWWRHRTYNYSGSQYKLSHFSLINGNKFAMMVWDVASREG
jgi:hypothetical protein